MASHSPLSGADLNRLNELAQEAHEIAVDGGHYDHPRSVHELLVLIHSEVTEILRAMDDTPPLWDFGALRHTEEGDLLKPEGVAVEIADVILRCLDMAAWLHVDIAEAVASKMYYNMYRQDWPRSS